jgi:hypothetical protein
MNQALYAHMNNKRKMKKKKKKKKITAHYLLKCVVKWLVSRKAGSKNKFQAPNLLVERKE